MSPETRYLLKHALIHTERYDLALERFPNLRGLERVGDLGRPIKLSVQPKLDDVYLTNVGILI